MVSHDRVSADFWPATGAAVVARGAPSNAGAAVQVASRQSVNIHCSLLHISIHCGCRKSAGQGRYGHACRCGSAGISGRCTFISRRQLPGASHNAGLKGDSSHVLRALLPGHSWP